MTELQPEDKRPTPDPAEDNAFFPSPYSLSQFTSPNSDLEGADYPNAYQGGRLKVLMIGADERYLLTDNGTMFSTISKVGGGPGHGRSATAIFSFFDQ